VSRPNLGDPCDDGIRWQFGLRTRGVCQVLWTTTCALRLVLWDAMSQMNDLLDQARAGDAQREDVRQEQLAERSRHFAAQQDDRAETIRDLVKSWVQSMAAADHPGIQVLSEEYSRTRGIVSRREEIVVREVPGWEVVEQKVRSGPYGDTYARLFITADERLLFHGGSVGRPREFMPEDEFSFERGQRLSRGHPPLIDALPVELVRVAKANGVGWSPSRSLPPHPEP
jgi:hypothetical protein